MDIYPRRTAFWALVLHSHHPSPFQIFPPLFSRFFRVVPAPTFLAKFSSDRRHMKKPDGSWMKPPPNYPIIQVRNERASCMSCLTRFSAQFQAT